MAGQENWGPQGHNPEQVPFPGYFGGPQLYMSYYGLMGFNSYQSVLSMQDRSWAQVGSLFSFYGQRCDQVLGSCFSAKKPMKKGRAGRLELGEGLTLLLGLGYSWSPRATPSLPCRDMGHWSHLPGSALLCGCYSAQVLPGKQWERGRGTLTRLAQGVQCQPPLVCRNPGQEGREEVGEVCSCDTWPLSHLVHFWCTLLLERP